MALKTDAQLQEWVLQRLDEVTPEGSEPSVDAEVLRNELVEAARDAVLEAPAMLLTKAADDYATEGNSAKEVSVVTDEDGEEVSVSLVVPLPHDTLRVMRMTLAGWTVPLREDGIVLEGSEEHDELLAGEVEATVRYPAAVLKAYHDADATDTETASHMALEAWPLTDADRESDSPVTELLCVPVLDPASVPEDLQDAMVWIAVARIAGGYFKDYAAAQFARGEAASSFKSRMEKFSRLASRPRVSRTADRSYNYL